MPKRSRSTLLREWLGQKQACELLESESEGLYEEIDKLCKKAPSESVTNLQVNAVNGFIKRSKKLLEGDPIIDEVTVFVAAGDNPEYRDVVTVLRQVNQGLERFRNRNKYLWDDDFDDELTENQLDDTDAISFW